MVEVKIESTLIQLHAAWCYVKQSWGLSFKFSSTARCKATVNLVWTLQISRSWADLLFVALLCSAADSLGMMSSLVTYHSWFLQSNSSLPMWIYLKMYDWFSLCLPMARQSSPLSDESYFLPVPHTDSWCVLFTSNTSAQTSSMYRSLSLKKPISVALAAMNICATFGCALFPIQLPLSLQMSPIMVQCASSSGYIKSNFLSDEKPRHDCPNVKLSPERHCNVHRACGWF